MAETRSNGKKISKLFSRDNDCHHRQPLLVWTLVFRQGLVPAAQDSKATLASISKCRCVAASKRLTCCVIPPPRRHIRRSEAIQPEMHAWETRLERKPGLEKHVNPHSSEARLPWDFVKLLCLSVFPVV